MGIMSKVMVLLDRRPRWRPHRLTRRVGLTLTTHAEYASRAGAIQTDSAGALATGPVVMTRVWVVPGAEPAADHSRIVRVDGLRQPTLDEQYLDHPSIERAYLRMRSAIVFPHVGLVMPESGTVLQSHPRNWLVEHKGIHGFGKFDRGRLWVTQHGLQPVRRIQQPLFNLCKVNHRNYAHWLLSYLPWLLPWLGHLRSGRLAVLVPPLLNAWQRRMLELLGVPVSGIVEAPEGSVQCDDLIEAGLYGPGQPEPDAGGPPTSIGPRRRWFVPPGLAVLETVDRLKAAVPLRGSIEPPERIYISRRGGNSFRTLQNEAEVEVAAPRLGFTIVRTEDHSFDDQIALFSRARVVIGPHGAGMTNTVFAPPGCLVCDFFPTGWESSWSLRLTQLFGHYYLPLSFPSEPRASGGTDPSFPHVGRNHVYRVPVEELAAVVADAMRISR